MEEGKEEEVIGAGEAEVMGVGGMAGEDAAARERAGKAVEDWVALDEEGERVREVRGSEEGSFGGGGEAGEAGEAGDGWIWREEVGEMGGGLWVKAWGAVV